MWQLLPLAFSVALIAWLLAGYPLFLAVRRRRSAPPVRKDPRFRTTVSVVLAVHNGAPFLAAKLDSLLGLEYPPRLLDILVVSDGSTDETDAIAEAYASRGIRLVRIPRAGKAAALNAGMAKSSGEIVFFTDVRQALASDALSQIVADFADPTVGAVTGELRYLGPETVGEQADMKTYWRYEVWVRRRHSEIDSMFGATGCIYAIRRSLTAPLPADTLADDAVIPLRAFFRGYRVIFEPEALAFDYPTETGGEFRRKLRTLAGLWQVHARMPQLFSGSNRMRIHFLSHKFGRLLLPWLILLAFAAVALFPPSLVRTLLLAGSAAVALLAIADPAVPGKSLAKSFTSPARTFLAMNAASLLSVLVFIVPPATLWRTTRVTVENEEVTTADKL